MKTHSVTIFSVSLLLLFILSTTAVDASSISNAAQYSSDTGFYYICDDNSCTLTAYDGDEDNLSVPSNIDNFNVSGIGDECFAYNSTLISVIIADGIENIGDNAFDGCSSLQTIQIPSSVTSLGEGVFSGCDNLTILLDKDSFAESYCLDAGLTYEYIDSAASLTEAASDSTSAAQISKAEELFGLSPITPFDTARKYTEHYLKAPATGALILDEKYHYLDEFIVNNWGLRILPAESFDANNDGSTETDECIYEAAGKKNPSIKLNLPQLTYRINTLSRMWKSKEFEYFCYAISQNDETLFAEESRSIKEPNKLGLYSDISRIEMSRVTGASSGDVIKQPIVMWEMENIYDSNDTWQGIIITCEDQKFKYYTDDFMELRGITRIGLAYTDIDEYLSAVSEAILAKEDSVEIDFRNLDQLRNNAIVVCGVRYVLPVPLREVVDHNAIPAEAEYCYNIGEEYVLE